MKELDGGQLDEPELSRSAAVRQICEGLELEIRRFRMHRCL